MKKETLYYLGGLIVTLGGIFIFTSLKKKDDSIDGVTTKDNFWKKVLYGVISVENGFNTPCDNIWSRGCTGKRYTDVLHLDSGTIGIAHFASGGLKKVYQAMDTEKYFGRSEKEMIDNYASRTSGASDNQWWIDGFKRWVNNPKHNKIQDRLFKDSRQEAVNDAKKNGWTTDREFAIAVGVSNSYGNSGFRNHAEKYNWNAEDILDAYVYKFSNDFSNHKNKRKKQINKWFPKNKQVKINL
jgi:hypothetical protein|tara:strand:- start:12206 stop:12928 length:723 start_codon:yes stop_codon:yes gene_type:complete